MERSRGTTFRPEITPSRCGMRSWVSSRSRSILKNRLQAGLILSIDKCGIAIVAVLIALSGCGRSATGSYRVYVSNEGSGDMTVIDPVKMEALATLPFGKRARGIHPSSDGKLMFVALSGSPFAPPGVDESTLPPPDKSADGIGVFDLAQGRVLRRVPGGSDPEQFAVSRDRKLLYASNGDAAGVRFLDPPRGRGLKTLATRRGPAGVRPSPHG